MISESVFLDYINTDKFKKARFSVVLSLPADSNQYAAGALLFPVSMRATKIFPDFSSLCKRCDELYAADISDMSSLRGGVSLLGLRAQMLDNRYASESERNDGFDILAGVLQVMSQIMFSPLFKKEDVENEKLNLINRIRSQINDPFGFALRRLRETMMANTPGVISSSDAIDQISKITEKEISDYRAYLLSKARVEFFYCGTEPIERVTELIKDNFYPVLQNSSERASAFKDREIESTRFVEEEGEYSQSQLLMGFRSNTFLSDEDFYAAELANEIFGEGPVSKLFMNLREKRSLCYFCGSGYDEINGIVTAGCGIAAKDRKEAQKEIFCQLEALKNGKISDEELNAAKQSIFSDCAEAEDNPEDYEEFSRMARAFGGPKTIEEYRSGISQVTKDQISAAAQKFKLDTVYFLRGTAEER